MIAVRLSTVRSHPSGIDILTLCNTRTWGCKKFYSSISPGLAHTSSQRRIPFASTPRLTPLASLVLSRSYLAFTFGTAVFPYTTHRSPYPSNKITAALRSDARCAIYPEISRTSFYGSIESLSSPVFAGCRLIFVLISVGSFPGVSCAVERPRFMAMRNDAVRFRFINRLISNMDCVLLTFEASLKVHPFHTSRRKTVNPVSRLKRDHFQMTSFLLSISYVAVVPP